jgi:hypothetical protein
MRLSYSGVCSYTANVYSWTNRGSSACILVSLLVLALMPSAAVAQFPRKADLIISVMSPDAAPVGDATVSIVALGLTARTDWLGEGRLRQVPNGRYRLNVRRIGFTPASVDIDVYGDTVGAFLVLTPATIVLDTLRVVAAAATQWNLGAFERRKAMGIGRFLDDTLLDRQGVANLAVMLSQQLPGLWAVSDAARPGFYKLLSKRSRNSLRPRESECEVDVYLDGARYYESVDAIRPLDLAGVELYSMDAAPVEYRRGTGSCHVLLLWLRFGNHVQR